MSNLTAIPIAPGAPIVDLQTGGATTTMLRFMLALWQRTGNSLGVATVDVQASAAAAQASAVTAQAAAAAAQASANAASSAVAAEAVTRAAADSTEATTRATADTNEATTRATADTNEATTRATAITTEANARIAADALLAPIASPVFTGAAPTFALFGTYASDALAAAGGIVVGQLYWSGTAVVQRRV